MMIWRGLLHALAFLAVGLLFSSCSGKLHPSTDSAVTQILIDDNGPAACWGKTLGDINGDGLIDLLVGGHQPSKPGLFTRLLTKFKIRPAEPDSFDLLWYENPDWTRHTISTSFPIRTDMEVGDIDGNGTNDVVALTDDGVIFFRNPGWETTTIDSRKFHDIELADLDLNGRLDIILRNQSSFNYNNGDVIIIYFQEDALKWRSVEVPVNHGEGLKVADLDGDNYPDIIVNDFWLKNPRLKHASEEWTRNFYSGQWKWQDVYINTYDMNRDGAPDILLAPAEMKGQYYRLSWFESMKDGSEWTEHIIDNDVEAVHHFIAGGDFNGDDLIDIFTAGMNQGERDHAVEVYVNTGNSQNAYNKLVLDSFGSHSMRVADLDGDFADEVFGANWQIENHWDNYPVKLWDWKPDKPAWKRHLIGDNAPHQNLFISAHDLDSDGHADIATGNSWYRNPGTLSSDWQRFRLEYPANNVITVADFDGDGHPEILSSKWDSLLEKPSLLMRLTYKLTGRRYPGSLPGNEFVLLRNSGGSDYKPSESIPAGPGDFLQGYAIDSQTDNNSTSVFLSWHKPGFGLQKITFASATEPSSTIEQVSDFSQDEALSLLDVNRDGRDDLITGTYWLDAADNWRPHRITITADSPDRNVIADIDNDSLPDVVVGYEAVSKLGKLAWYKQPNDPYGQWQEYVIDWIVGPMSVAASDMDGDGDVDIIAGEHNLSNPNRSRLILYDNLGGNPPQWKPKLIAVGDEHHDGALIYDLDHDGDKDIVSIGFSHSKIIAYENPMINP